MGGLFVSDQFALRAHNEDLRHGGTSPAVDPR